MKKAHYKDDLKAILQLTASTFADEVIHLAKDQPQAKKIFLVKKLGHIFINQEAMMNFLEENCQIKRDETIENPLNALFIGKKLVCSWYDFADVIGRVLKN
jgi:Zn-dependent peptidase ImmA (M78 family)